MKKYAEIAQLTSKYLEGKLQRLTMEYVDSNILKVSVVYEDSYDYFYDYDLEINSHEKEYNFLGHQCKSSLFKLKLDREAKFERAVFDFLYSLT